MTFPIELATLSSKLIGSQTVLRDSGGAQFRAAVFDSCLNQLWEFPLNRSWAVIAIGFNDELLMMDYTSDSSWVFHRYSQDGQILAGPVSMRAFYRFWGPMAHYTR